MRVIVLKRVLERARHLLDVQPQLVHLPQHVPVLDHDGILQVLMNAVHRLGHVAGELRHGVAQLLHRLVAGPRPA